MVKVTIKVWYGWLDEISIAFIHHLSILLSCVCKSLKRLRLFFFSSRVVALIPICYEQMIKRIASDEKLKTN
jgi:hypothetical protein